MEPLKLYARDGDDVAVISACLQDAVGQIGDMTHLANERRFVMLLNRYCWEAAPDKLRVRAALQIAGVTAIQHKGLTLKRRDGVVSLLAVQAASEKDGSMTLNLVFAGGGEIRLDVEACEVILEDITAPWGAQSRPAHAVPDEAE